MIFQWITPSTAKLTESLPRAGVFSGAVSCVGSASQLSEVFQAARQAGLETLLLPEGWAVQLDPSHPKRIQARSVGLEWLKGTFSPSQHAVSPDVAEEVAERHHQAQVLAGASAEVAPSHWYPDAHGLTRDFDLQVARKFSELARGSAFGRSGSERRALVLEVGVAGPQLRSSTAIRDLVSAYSEIEADGYWLAVRRFSGSPQQYRGIRELAKRLEIASGRPCIVQGAGHMSIALLADGVAATCVGWGGRVPNSRSVDNAFFAELHDADAKSDAREGVGVSLNFAEILGGVPIGPRGEEARRLLLRELRLAAPKTQLAHHLHNLFVADQLARRVWRLPVDQRSVWLTTAVGHASVLRRKVGMAPLPDAWGAAGDLRALGQLHPPVSEESIFWSARYVG